MNRHPECPQWADQFLVIFGQFVPLSKNIKCSSPPNHACSNKCFFSITKPWNRSSLIFTQNRSLRFFVQDSKMWFFFLENSKMWFFLGSRFGYGKKPWDEMNILYFWTRELPQTDQVSAQWTLWTVSQIVIPTLDDNFIQLHVKNPELFL